MKKSRYNHICSIENSEDTLLFNCNSCGLAQVDNETMNDIVQIMYNLDNGISIDFENSTVKELIKGKFIVNNEVDEFKNLHLKNRMNRFKSKTLSLTLAPTLGCNFYCTYCYESNTSQKDSQVMTYDTLDLIVEFIKKYVKQYDTENLFIGWYGGEPLIEYDFIIDACKKFNDLASDLNLKINYNMVSNGYLLNEIRAEELKKLGFLGVQITVDGVKKIHDKRRMLKSREGTFNTIIKNIIEISDILNVGLRVNVDKENIEQVEEFLCFLKNVDLTENISISFAATTADTEICRSYASACLSDEEFSKKSIELYKLAFQHNMKINNFPMPITTWCSAVQPGHFLIEPNGDIQKCWAYIGNKEKSIGQIDNPQNLINMSVQWLLWEPFNTDKCIECNILPICMGGCPYKAFELNDSIPVCSTWKYNLEECLKFNFEMSSFTL